MNLAGYLLSVEFESQTTFSGPSASQVLRCRWRQLSRTRGQTNVAHHRRRYWRASSLWRSGALPAHNLLCVWSTKGRRCPVDEAGPAPVTKRRQVKFRS